MICYRTRANINIHFGCYDVVNAEAYVHNQQASCVLNTGLHVWQLTWLKRLLPFLPYDNRKYLKSVKAVRDEYLETASAVTAAGSLLSFRSNAVCIVSLLRNTSCFCQWKPSRSFRCWTPVDIESLTSCLVIKQNSPDSGVSIDTVGIDDNMSVLDAGGTRAAAAGMLFVWDSSSSSITNISPADAAAAGAESSIDCWCRSLSTAWHVGVASSQLSFSALNQFSTAHCMWPVSLSSDELYSAAPRFVCRLDTDDDGMSSGCDGDFSTTSAVSRDEVSSDLSLDFLVISSSSATSTNSRLHIYIQPIAIDA